MKQWFVTWLFAWMSASTTMADSHRAFELLPVVSMSLKNKGAEDCHKIRAAFDLGSGAFKVKVAQINTCTQTIEKIILSDSIKTAFKDSVVDGNIPEAALQRGRDAVIDFFSKAKNAGATQYYGVGTQVFRDIKNASEFLNSLPPEISIRLISQREEAILGYASATSALNNRDPSIVVWDIGAGSMQITTRDDEGNFIFYEGKIASNAAREMSKKNPTETSPNPIGANKARTVETKIIEKARTDLSLSQETKRLLALASDRRMIGIGGVHNQSVLNQVNKVNAKSSCIYTQSELKKTIVSEAVKTDSEIGGKYADTDVSNLLLVSGFMKSMGIDQVEAVDANLANGLLVSGFSLLGNHQSK